MPAFSPRIRGHIDEALTFLKWVLYACNIGLIVGAVAVAFHYGIDWAAQFRAHQPWVILFLPLGGVVIVLLYRWSGMERDRGTNLVLTAVREAEPIRLRTAPLIFLSTILTHLVGGSAGREGAALQIGGSIGHKLGCLLKLDDRDLHIITAAGMAAGFSALFGTPIGAAVFAMEVVSVGVMYYSAIIPCFLSAFLAKLVAGFFGISSPALAVQGVPELTFLSLLSLLALGGLCALVAILFCGAMQLGGLCYSKLTSRRWVRAALGGLVVVLLTLLSGTTDYNGAGMDVILRAVAGTAVPWAFLLKILFTVLTLRAGYKGGEIVPAFFIGATFGCVAGPLLGLSASFGAAAGMIAVFCGVTNCPLTSILLAYVLFAGVGMAPMTLTIAAAYMLSGYCGLYHEQLIMYSKTKSRFIRQNAGESYQEE